MHTFVYIIPKSDLDPGVVVPTPNPAPVVVSRDLEPGVVVPGSNQPSVVDSIGKHDR